MVPLFPLVVCQLAICVKVSRYRIGTCFQHFLLCCVLAVCPCVCLTCEVLIFSAPRNARVPSTAALVHFCFAFRAS